MSLSLPHHGHLLHHAHGMLAAGFTLDGEL
jgi:hypothetical protein